MTDYTAQEKLAEIEREIRMRRKVYPGLVANGMSDALAKRQIAIMQAIAEDYRREAGQAQLPL